MLSNLTYQPPHPPESIFEPSCAWHGRSETSGLTDGPTKCSRPIQTLQSICSVCLSVNNPRTWGTLTQRLHPRNQCPSRPHLGYRGNERGRRW
ncbi:hypothetical protein MRX96_025711 [Rhipicephalus microplus]